MYKLVMALVMSEEGWLIGTWGSKVRLIAVCEDVTLLCHTLGHTRTGGWARCHDCAKTSFCQASGPGLFMQSMAITLV